MDSDKPSTLLRMDNSIINPTTALFAVSQIRKYFADAHKNPPPLPDSIFSLVPFNVHITSMRGPKKVRMGTIQLIKPDGKVCYEASWQLDK